MKNNVSKTNLNLDFFNQRLDEIRMNGHERLKAKARFAQAEAIAEALSMAIHWIGSLFKRPARRPGHRTATSAG